MVHWKTLVNNGKEITNAKIGNNVLIIGKLVM